MPTPFLRRWMLPSLLLLAAFALSVAARAAEVIPEVPTRYFNDYALTVKPETADRLNRELEDLEKQSSNQILVVIYPKMQTESSIEDYCHRTYASWHVGQQGRNNAAVLFVFVQDHKMRIETGRGLEGALPDSVCKDIISDQIAPKFKAGDYDGGLTTGVESMIKATKGEYQGTGRTVYQNKNPGGSNSGGGLGIGVIFFFIFIAFILFSSFRGGRGGGIGGLGGAILGGTLLGGGGGGYSGGGGSSDSGDGGGFSAGGGDSGAGGGASGDW